MTRPLWQDLAEAADTLALAGKVDKPTLQLLRASAVQMENWFIGNSELREELAEASQRIGQQDQALLALADTLQHAARFARLEVTMDEFGEAVRDDQCVMSVPEMLKYIRDEPVTLSPADIAKTIGSLQDVLVRMASRAALA